MLSSILYSVIIFGSTVFAVSSIQWLAMKFIMKFCYDDSLWGLVRNMFTLGSPICIFVNNIQTTLMNQYIMIWAGAATALITFIVKNVVK